MSNQGKEAISGGSASPSIRAEQRVPAEGTGSGGALPRSIEELEEAFVRCHALERREPGGGRWPFAGDGPWHLIQAEAGDFGGDGQDGVSSSRVPRPPLDSGEVAELALLRRWLLLVPEERDRKLVWTATARLHAGEGRVPWTALGRWMQLSLTPEGVARRYRIALAQALCALQGWPKRRARQLLKRDGLVADPQPGTRSMLFDGQEYEVSARRRAG